MIKIDDPSPLQLTPGTARVHHLFENLMVIGAWVMALIADIDQTQALTIDLSQNRLEQITELIRDRSLTGFGHLPQINGPHALAPAVEHGDRGRGALLGHAPAQRHKDAVAPNRKRRPKAPFGGAGLLDPVHHLVDLGILTMRGHPRTQLPRTLRREVHDHFTP